MVNSAGTTLSTESFLPTEVGCPERALILGTPNAEFEVRMGTSVAAGFLLITMVPVKLYQELPTVKVVRKV
jgi:hypothetical protein